MKSTTTLGIGAALAGVIAAIGGLLLAGQSRSRRPSPGAGAGTSPTDAHQAQGVADRVAAGDEGHAAPDLAADAGPAQRAPVAFRPDMDAPMTAAEREALRPATGLSPTLVDAGTSMPG